MERIGFGEQPYLVYKHNDAAHTHVHIATINIKPDGKRIDTHGIGWKLSEPARIALEPFVIFSGAIRLIPSISF